VPDGIDDCRTSSLGSFDDDKDGLNADVNEGSVEGGLDPLSMDGLID